MLRPKKKITRKELKKDPVLEKISQIDSFVRTQRNLVMYISLGVVAVVVLTILIIGSKRKANTAAMGDLGLAKMSIARNDYDDAILRLENLIDKYSRTHSAGMATILLARSYLAKDDYENARINFEKYADDYDDDAMLAATAYSGLGICAEQNSDFKAAAEYFEKGAKKSPYKFQKHELLLNSVRNYLKFNDYESAEKLVNVLLQDEPEAKNKNSAELLAAQITAQKDYSLK
ncbi:MAG: tetratricopeptide repeat protein [Candidatus Neomarinimicrobiota bacterium]